MAATRFASIAARPAGQTWALSCNELLLRCRAPPLLRRSTWHRMAAGRWSYTEARLN